MNPRLLMRSSPLKSRKSLKPEALSAIWDFLLKGVFGLRDLIEYLVKSLVDDPGQVNITEVAGDESTTYEVRVAATDLGKVIGKQGKIANSLRTIAKAAAMRDKKRVYVEIIP